MPNNNHPTFGNGKICYVELPAIDINRSAAFYGTVFGWQIRTDRDGGISFDDAVNEVSGTWVTNRKPTTEQGYVIHIMVDDAEATLGLIIENGGTVVQDVDMDAPEITAKFADPAGNIVGLYQHGTTNKVE